MTTQIFLERGGSKKIYDFFSEIFGIHWTIRCFGTRGKGDSQFNTPKGVDVDGESRIVVCDLGNKRVSVFEKDGTFLFSFGKGHMECPGWVVVDSFGSILVSQPNKKSVQLWKSKNLKK